jgi:hypothetical protein
MADRSEFFHVRKRKPGSFDEDRERMEYWLSRPPEERLAEVERLRIEHWGEEYASQPRLPRPIEVTKRKRR